MSVKTAKRIALAVLLALSSGIVYSQTGQSNGATTVTATNAVPAAVATNAAPAQALESSEGQQAESPQDAVDRSAEKLGIMGASYVEDLRTWLASKLGMDANGFFFSLVFLVFCVGFLYLLLKGLNLLHSPIRHQVSYWGLVRFLAFVSGSASLWISFLCPDRPLLPTVLMCGLILFTMIIAWMFARRASGKALTSLGAVGLVLADCAFIAIVLLFSKVLIQEIIMAIVIAIGLYVVNVVCSRRRK